MEKFKRTSKIFDVEIFRKTNFLMFLCSYYHMSCSYYYMGSSTSKVKPKKGRKILVFAKVMIFSKFRLFLDENLGLKLMLTLQPYFKIFTSPSIHSKNIQKSTKLHIIQCILSLFYEAYTKKHVFFGMVNYSKLIFPKILIFYQKSRTIMYEHFDCN